MSKQKVKKKAQYEKLEAEIYPSSGQLTRIVLFLFTPMTTVTVRPLHLSEPNSCSCHELFLSPALMMAPKREDEMPNQTDIAAAAATSARIITIIIIVI